MMKTIATQLFLAAGICLTVMLLKSCSTDPLTGRKQLNLIPGSEMLSMSRQQYNDFLKNNKVIPATDKQSVAVKTVGKRIQSAVEQYAGQNGISLSGYNWEFNLVENKEKNAWCMPGGKVVVYSGILPLTGNDVGLAVVLGHEIAHAVAGHGAERMSQGLLAQLGSTALSQALSETPKPTR